MPPMFKEGAQLSDKEKTILAVAWKCIDGDVKIDWKKLGDLGGYTNFHSAQNCFVASKKKLMEITGDDNEEVQGPSEPTTPAKGKKRAGGPGRGRKKRVADDEEAGDEGGDEASTPTAKKAKKGVAKPKVTKDKDDDEEMKIDEGEGEA